jgi:hypothetical protein
LHEIAFSRREASKFFKQLTLIEIRGRREGRVSADTHPREARPDDRLRRNPPRVVDERRMTPSLIPPTAWALMWIKREPPNPNSRIRLQSFHKLEGS